MMIQPAAKDPVVDILTATAVCSGIIAAAVIVAIYWKPILVWLVIFLLRIFQAIGG